MTVSEIVVLLSALGALIGSVLLSSANYRNSVRKADFDRLIARTTETEARLAQAEHRATTAEIQAATFRQDVIDIGEALAKERKMSDRNLGIVAKDAEEKISKLMIVIEDLYNRIESVTGVPPDVDMSALRKIIIVDHVTGPLGPINLIELIRSNQ